MTFYDPTLYGRDDEEEFGDSGAYSESLEEDFEEEEEEEEAELPGVTGSRVESEIPMPPAPMPTSGGGGGSSKCEPGCSGLVLDG